MHIFFTKFVRSFFKSNLKLYVKSAREGMLTDEASEVGGGKDGDRDGGKGRSEGGNGGG